MPRILARAGILVALLTPAFAFAAFDDVTLTTDTVLTVGGVTLNVSGSSATVESITVNDANFSFNLQSGSTIQVTAPNINILTADTATDRTVNTCTSEASIMKYVGTAARTVTITTSGTLCTNAGGGGGSGSGGGGGGGAAKKPVTPAPVTPPVNPATPGSGLSSAQVTAILNVLTSFGADAATIAKVQAALMRTGSTAPGSVTSTAVSVFKANLTTGSLGQEVKMLQEFLNKKGYTVSSSGPGSAGNETMTFGNATKAALMKYQKDKGITPVSGFFGPKTRAAINAEQ